MYVDEKLPITRLAQFIKESYSEKTGLVYCSDEEYCKTLVKNLNENWLSSIFYTDALTDKEKIWINRENQSGVNYFNML